jgi:hypothetical protein
MAVNAPPRLRGHDARNSSARSLGVERREHRFDSPLDIEQVQEMVDYDVLIESRAIRRHHGGVAPQSAELTDSVLEGVRIVV